MYNNQLLLTQYIHDWKSIAMEKLNIIAFLNYYSEAIALHDALYDNTNEWNNHWNMLLYQHNQAYQMIDQLHHTQYIIRQYIVNLKHIMNE